MSDIRSFFTPKSGGAPKAAAAASSSSSPKRAASSKAASPSKGKGKGKGAKAKPEPKYPYKTSSKPGSAAASPASTAPPSSPEVKQEKKKTVVVMDVDGGEEAEEEVELLPSPNARPRRDAAATGRKRRVIESDEDEGASGGGGRAGDANDDDDAFEPAAAAASSNGKVKAEESAGEDDDDNDDESFEADNSGDEEISGGGRSGKKPSGNAKAKAKASSGKGGGSASKRAKTEPKAEPVSQDVSKYFEDSNAAAPAPSQPGSRGGSLAVDAMDVEDDVVVAETKPAAAAAASAARPELEAAAAVAAPPTTAAARSQSPGGSASGASTKKAWSGQWNQPRKEPPAAGSKEVPKGAPQCFDKQAFVISGVLPSLTREGAEDVIKSYGGKVTAKVSSRTTFLLLGTELDDGRKVDEGTKYRDAKEHKTKLIHEQDLFEMLKKSGEAEEAKQKAKAATGRPANPYAPRPVNPYAAPPKAAAKPATTKAGKAAAATVKSLAATAAAGLPGEMWADRYAPKRPEDLLGHGETVNKLKRWLEHWNEHHLGSGSPPAKGINGENPGAKAALLSGPPGIGKTTAATVLAKALGYQVRELNASDTRSKRSLEDELSTLLGNSVISFAPKSRGSGGGSSSGSGKSGKAITTKALVIMDEVDGMSGGDRGGSQELIKLMKTSKVPIICICNDRQSPKIRTLANHCYDLKFKRPLKTTVAKRMKDIAAAEGLDIELNAVESLVESVGNDIRQVLHALQMWSLKANTVRYMDLKAGLSGIEKDKTLRVSVFDAVRVVLSEAGRTPLADRSEAFFIDYSLMPLLVQQNYIDSVIHSADKATALSRLADAAEACSDADLAATAIGMQEWSLLPMSAMLNVRVGNFSRGYLGQGGQTFPEWLGRNSTRNKNRRLASELRTHMNGRISANPEEVRLLYLPALRDAIALPLMEAKNGDLSTEDAIEATVELMDEYGLSRDDFIETLPAFLLKGQPDPLKGLDTKTKTALTRAYNARCHKSQALVEAITAPKKGRKAAAAGDDEGEVLEGDAADDAALEAAVKEEEDEEEEEGAAAAAAFAKKGKRGAAAGGKKPGAGKAAAGKSRKGASGTAAARKAKK